MRTTPSYAEHVEKLKDLMKERNPCNYCPWSHNYGDPLTICYVCRKFVGINGPVPSSDGDEPVCPCYVLGEFEALEITKARLAKEYDWSPE